MTVGLAILQATGIAYQMNNGILFGRGGTTQLPNGESLIPNFDVPHVALIVLTITAGTAVVMWMGELVTQRGVGNGMSILIFTNVVSTMPAQFANIKATAGFALFTVVMIMGLAMIVAIVFVEQGQRRIPVQFAKRVVGRRMYCGQSTYIPLKVNQAGVKSDARCRSRRTPSPRRPSGPSPPQAVALRSCLRRSATVVRRRRGTRSPTVSPLHSQHRHTASIATNPPAEVRPCSAV